VLIIQVNHPALYKCIGNDACTHIQYIARADYNIGIFTCFNATCSAGYAKASGGV
jgi:hypothetical protein